MSEFTQVMKEGFSKVGQIIRRFFVAILIIAAIGGILFLWISSWTYSQGTRAGFLIKMSHKGVVFKTYEGQLNLGGVSTDETSGLIGNIWDFSVGSKEIYEELQKYEGKKVELTYRQRYRTMPWQGETTYFIDRVVPIE